MPGERLRGLSGTPDYVAPEVLSWYEGDDEHGQPFVGEMSEYTAEADGVDDRVVAATRPRERVRCIAQ